MKHQLSFYKKGFQYKIAIELLNAVWNLCISKPESWPVQNENTKIWISGKKFLSGVDAPASWVFFYV